MKCINLKMLLIYLYIKDKISNIFNKNDKFTYPFY